VTDEKDERKPDAALSMKMKKTRELSSTVPSKHLAHLNRSTLPVSLFPSLAERSRCSRRHGSLLSCRNERPTVPAYRSEPLQSRIWH